VASAPRLESLRSREGVFLANNLLLTLFAFTVLVGTMYPLVLEAFTGREVTVGRPFFDRATIPIAFALLLAMGIGPVTPYRVAHPEVVWKRIRSPLTAGLLAGALAVVAGVWSVAVVIVVVLATFVIGVIVRALWVRWRAGRDTPEGGSGLWRILRSDPGYWGGQLSHIGVALMAVAIAASSALAVRSEVRLEAGQAVVVDDYCVVYDGPVNRTEPNRLVQGVAVRVLRDDCSTEVALLQPRVNVYNNSSQAVATPAVHTGLTEDVYLSIAGGGADAVTLDVFIFPLMWLLWAGGLVTVAGGAWSLLAVKPKRKVVPAGAGRVSEELDV
jgi:cytochrome c-type biogenesis protein CcmF